MIDYVISISDDCEKVYSFDPKTEQSVFLRANTWSGVPVLNVGEVFVFPHSSKNYVAVMEHLEHTGKIGKFTPDNIQLALLSIQSVRK